MSIIKGYVNEAGRRAGALGQTANHWSKNQLGVDVADRFSDLYVAAKDRMGGPPGGGNYGSLSGRPTWAGSGQFQDVDETATTGSLSGYRDEDTTAAWSTSATTSTTRATTSANLSSNAAPKRDDDWENW